VATVACEDEHWTSPIAFETGSVWIYSRADSFLLDVDIASEPEQWSLGLSLRPELSPESGMFFAFSDIQVRSFWMWRTHMALDVAFVSDNGSILGIQAMSPCIDERPVSCPRYPPPAGYLSALEVNAGWFDHRGIGPGDSVRLVVHGDR